MSIKWVSPDQGFICSQIEGTFIREQLIISGTENYEINLVSGILPNGTEIIKNENDYYLEGTLDLVSESTFYYFTLEAKDLNTQEISQRWFSIEVITLDTKWDINNDDYLEIFEKQFYQYQYKLENPEGNEVFKKISGELPEGVILSETGLLYGVPEEDREDLYEFKIGIYRNEKLVIKSDILSIKVKDIKELNKPIWITDAGILEYVEYNVKKDINVVAYDFNNKKVYYKLIEKNLPQGLNWYPTTTEEGENSTETGIIYGVCETKVLKDNWFIKLIPYILREENGRDIESNRIYGDEREFIIISNAIESDKLIKWITESLDPVKIGYTYSLQLEAECSDKIIFELASGELPKGLFLNKKGEIYGTIDYQDLGNYEFFIKAYTLNTFSTKKFIITVEEGLSENALNTFLYINHEYQESYQDILNSYDRNSSYNSSNYLYKTPSSPKINVATLNTWDNVLLKYKFEQFNTPIDIYMWETKKKSLPNYDLFYKDFDESNRISEIIDLKKHELYKDYNPEEDQNTLYRKSNETIMTDKFENEFVPGYKRNFINENEIKVVYKDINGNKITDSNSMANFITGEVDKDKENHDRYIYHETNPVDDKTYYYIIDLKATSTGELTYRISDPVYEPAPYELKEEYKNPNKKKYNYTYFGRKYVLIKGIKKYVTEVPKGTYYEIKSQRIVNKNEPIYIKIELLTTGEEIITKYILKNDIEIPVNVLTEVTNVTYDPFSENDERYIVDDKSYSKIEIEENNDNYYYFNSSTINMKTTSIKEIRKIFSEKINVTKNNNDILYKVGNEEFIDEKRYDDELGKSIYQKYNQVYNITKVNDNKYIANLVDDETDERIFYIYTKLPGSDELKEIYYKNDDEYVPLIQREFILDGEVDNVFYTIYKKDSNIVFTNALFNFPDGKKYIYEKNDENSYAWFEVKEDKDVYIYYANENELYGYPKDIVLPNVRDEHVKHNVVQFLDEELEKDILPDYMEKEYEPILPLFFAIPNSHNTVLKNINAKEKEGNYWYGRKFIFYEIHFEPKYRDADTFTIDFYNHVNENSPKFQLI